MNHVKIAVISDLHGQFNTIQIPKCDLLIIAGDICKRGCLSEIEQFCHWIVTQTEYFDALILIAGNHDRAFMSTRLAAIAILDRYLPDKFVYLEDSSITYKNFKIYGSPWQPEFYNWAFNKPRGEPLKQIWQNIPTDVEILITHGPPFGIGDLVDNRHAGCLELVKRLKDLPLLCLHTFGHIHPGHGTYFADEFPNTHFCNAAVCTDMGTINKYAHVFDVYKDRQRIITVDCVKKQISE